jgi:carbon storage regulator
MLILRRRAGQSLIIADDIEIEVIEIGPTRVKLGIRAPQHVTVVRGEVRLTEAENVAAAESMTKERVDGLLVEIGKKDSHIRLAITDMKSGADLSGIQQLENPGLGTMPG